MSDSSMAVRPLVDKSDVAKDLMWQLLENYLKLASVSIL